MEQTPNQPLYWDKHRIPVNLTLILSLGIAALGLSGVVGLFDFGGNPNLIFVLGIGVAIYTWVSTPRYYLLYADALHVVYGRPRVKVIHFSNVDTVEMGSLATPDRLRVRPIRGRRQIVLVRDPEAFFDHLYAAVNAFRADHPEYDYALREASDEAAVDVADAASQPDDSEIARADGAAEPYAGTAEADAGTASVEAEAAEKDGVGDSQSDDPPKPPEPENRPLY